LLSLAVAGSIWHLRFCIQPRKAMAAKKVTRQDMRNAAEK